MITAYEGIFQFLQPSTFHGIVEVVVTAANNGCCSYAFQPIGNPLALLAKPSHFTIDEDQSNIGSHIDPAAQPTIKDNAY